MAMVFQNYALYPHKTVRAEPGVRPADAQAPARGDRTTRVARSPRGSGIDALLDRKPAQLSGGQRQRVALGRAIVREPQAFLLDEPLSNLDAQLRVEMRAELARLHRRLGGDDALRHARPGRGDDAGRPRRGARRGRASSRWRRRWRSTGGRPTPSWPGSSACRASTGSTAKVERPRCSAARSCACELPGLRGSARREVKLGIRPHDLACCAEGSRGAVARPRRAGRGAGRHAARARARASTVPGFGWSRYPRRRVARGDAV